jgi:HAMP domain-containing protein
VAQLAVQGEEGIMETRDYAGVPVLAAYRRIPFTGWGMVVKQDLAEIMVPIWRGAGMVALVGLAGVSLIFLLVVAVVNRALQPLQEVGRAAAALARGRLDQRVAATGTEDEIGLVGRAFNEMAAGLEAQFKVRKGSSSCCGWLFPP